MSPTEALASCFVWDPGGESSDTSTPAEEAWAVPVGVRAPVLALSSGRMESTEEVIVESPSGSLGSGRCLLMDVTPGFVVCSKEEDGGLHNVGNGALSISRAHCASLGYFV